MSSKHVKWIPVAAALMVFGCGEVQLDPADAGGDQCLPTETLCSESCTDTQTAHTNCGACGVQCANDEVCDMGSCSSTCSGGLESCGGSCVDTETDNNYCGDCATSCSTSETCESGTCIDLDTIATLAITSSWPDTTGWTDSNGTAITMLFEDSGLAGAVYQCRTGPESVIGAMAYTNCDGADGTTGLHRPAPVTGMEEGSYRTDVRLSLGAWNSDPISYSFYVHHSLDATPACDSAFTPGQIFLKAASELPERLAFDPATVVRRPFVSIPFKNITVHGGLKGGGGYSTINTGDSFTADILSLRHRWTLSSDRRWLLVDRVFESRNRRLGGAGTPHGSCANNYYFGTRSLRNCPFLVLNSQGEGVCLAPSATPGQLINTRGAGNTFSDGWVKLKRRDSYHKSFSEKYRGSCPGGTCSTWQLALPE